MGTSKYRYCNGRYQGSLTVEQCNTLENIIELNAQGGCADNLLHLICDMNDVDVDDLIADYQNYGYETREYPRSQGTLRDYQTLGVTFAYAANNFILGDSVGLGKTVVTAALCNLLTMKAMKNNEKYPYLILTEKNLSLQVQREMVKFTGEYVYRIASGDKIDIGKFINTFPTDEPLKYNIVGTHALLKAPEFISWFKLYLQNMEESPFKMLVVDESSVLGGKAKNQLVTAFKNFSSYFEKIIFLNATPFENNLQIFYNQLNLLDCQMLPTQTEFQKTYCIMRFNGMYNEPTGKYKNQEEFKKRIGYFYFARTRRDNGANIKNCKGGVIYSPLSKSQKYLLGRTHMNRFVFDCPTYLDDRIQFNEENVPKLKSLRELFEGEFLSAPVVLLFAYNKETQIFLYEWFTQNGITSQILNGDTPDKVRMQIIDDFKAMRIRVLITNVQKGLNFGSCNHVIFYGFDSNPSKMVQFEGRTTRSFDIENKNIYILCSEGLEANQLRSKAMTRAKATTDMTNVDISVVMDILLNPDGNTENNDEEA